MVLGHVSITCEDNILTLVHELFTGLEWPIKSSVFSIFDAKKRWLVSECPIRRSRGKTHRDATATAAHHVPCACAWLDSDSLCHYGSPYDRPLPQNSAGQTKLLARQFPRFGSGSRFRWN